jgi:hypothetical protein
MANKQPENNALQHGLTAARVVLPQLGETLEQWEAFRDGWRDVLQPHNGPETEQADRVAGIAWRLRRAEAYQLLRMTKAELPGDVSEIDAILASMGTGRRPIKPAEAAQRDTLARVLPLLDGASAATAQRYEVTLERQLQRNLALYAQLRAFTDREAA